MAIYYYKGPGQNALTAAGMEVAPSLYNLLVRMKREGYRIEHLPPRRQSWNGSFSVRVPYSMLMQAAPRPTF